MLSISARTRNGFELFAHDSTYVDDVFHERSSTTDDVRRHVNYPDTILLLDGYFFVVVHSGTTISQWRKANYQDLPDYAHFKRLLAEPVADAQQLAESRCPTPRLVECDQGGSQARFLLAKLNPSNTHQTQHQSGWEQQQNFGGGEIIFTDDISLSVFMQHLAKLAVAS